MGKQEVEITYGQLLRYVAAAFSIKPNEQSAPKTKLEYAIDRNRQTVEQAFEKYNLKVKDIRTDNALASKGDDKRMILDDKSNFTFSQEGSKEIDRQIEILKGEKIKIDAYWAKEVPRNLSLYIIEQLQPIAINPEYEIPDDTNLPSEVENKPEPKRAQ